MKKHASSTKTVKEPSRKKCPKDMGLLIKKYKKFREEERGLADRLISLQKEITETKETLAERGQEARTILKTIHLINTMDKKNLARLLESPSGTFVAIQMEENSELLEKIEDSQSLSWNSKWKLKQKGIKFFGELAQATPIDLVEWGLEHSEITEAREILNQMGLFMGVEIPDWKRPCD